MRDDFGRGWQAVKDNTQEELDWAIAEPSSLRERSRPQADSPERYCGGYTQYTWNGSEDFLSCGLGGVVECD